jgi:hypothetical protein
VSAVGRIAAQEDSVAYLEAVRREVERQIRESDHGDSVDCVEIRDGRICIIAKIPDGLGIFADADIGETYEVVKRDLQDAFDRNMMLISSDEAVETIEITGTFSV